MKPGELLTSKTLLLTTLVLILPGCDKPARGDVPTTQRYVHGNGMVDVLAIDGCEYLAFFDTTNSVGPRTGYPVHAYEVVVHKGNCTNRLHRLDNQMGGETTGTRCNSSSCKLPTAH